MDKLSASEALYGFCGWLTCRKERTVMSGLDSPGKIAVLINEFSERNGLGKPRPGWEKHMVEIRSRNKAYSAFYLKLQIHPLAAIGDEFANTLSSSVKYEG